MGNTFSSSNALHVQLTKPYYSAGEMLEGVVALNCINQLSTSGIQVEIIGYEETYYSVNTTTHSSFDDDAFNTAGTRTQQGHLDFFRVAMPLGPPGTLSPGQYQFGFKLQLPESLPPSFHHMWGGDRGDIKYKIRAFVEKSGFDIKSETEVIIVDQPVTTGPVGNAAQQNRMVVFSASSSGYNQSKNSKVAASAAVQGLSPGESAEGSLARRAVLQVPMDCPPSANGRIVQCIYILEVELKGGMGLSAVKTQVPLRISSSVAGGAGAVQLQAPDGWKPMLVFPTVDIPSPQMQQQQQQQPQMMVQQPQQSQSQYQYQQEQAYQQRPQDQVQVMPQQMMMNPPKQQQQEQQPQVMMQPMQGSAPMAPASFYQPPPNPPIV
ncbi:hypothetical protein Ndes2437B_g00204 [Nannochloris sp. 'desiccata']